MTANAEAGHQSGRGEPSAENRGTAVDNLLAQQLSDLARTLQAEDDVAGTLEAVVRAAVVLVPGADEGSISVVAGRRSVTSQHPTSDLPSSVDAVQTEVGQGPCLDAMFQQQTVRVSDMASEERWPQFAQRAFELGARSMLSFQLYVAGDNLGALNLYGRRVHAFTDDSEQVGLLVASHAAVSFADTLRINDVLAGIAGRDVIGQAKGILMERHQLSADQAFQVLVRISQSSNRKLRDIATELAETRTAPGLSRSTR